MHLLHAQFLCSEFSDLAAADGVLVRFGDVALALRFFLPLSVFGLVALRHVRDLPAVLAFED